MPQASPRGITLSDFNATIGTDEIKLVSMTSSGITTKQYNNDVVVVGGRQRRREVVGHFQIGDCGSHLPTGETHVTTIAPEGCRTS